MGRRGIHERQTGVHQPVRGTHQLVLAEAASMTYYGGKELAGAFRTVRKNTIQIAEDIPGEQYDYKATPESRTIRQTLVHIGVGTMFPTIVHGGKLKDMQDLDFQEFLAKISGEESKPRT